MDDLETLTSGGRELDSYRDLRSDYQPVRRRQKQAQKYYGYRGVKPSWIGQQFYLQPDTLMPRISFQPTFAAPLQASPEGARFKTWTKRNQYEYRSHDIWPLDHQHRVGRRKRRNCCYIPPRWLEERRVKQSAANMTWEVEQGLRVLTDAEVEASAGSRSPTEADIRPELLIDWRGVGPDERCLAALEPGDLANRLLASIAIQSLGSELDDEDYTFVSPNAEESDRQSNDGDSWTFIEYE